MPLLRAACSWSHQGAWCVHQHLKPSARSLGAAAAFGALPTGRVALPARRNTLCNATDCSPPDPHLDVSIDEVEAQLRVKLRGVHAASPASENADIWPPANTRNAEPRAPTRPDPASEGQLLLEAKAQKLGLNIQHFKTKFEELCLLLPGVTERELLSLESGTLKDLISDTASVAARLVQLRIRLSSGLDGRVQSVRQGRDLSQFLREHLEVLSSGRWSSFVIGIPLASLAGHAGGVSCLALAPGGRHVVSGAYDTTLRMWDLPAHVCTAALRGHAAWVTSVAMAADGCRAVSGSYDRTLKVWDLAASACIATLQGHTAWVTAVSVSADGRRAVSGSWDHTLRVWDLEAHTCIARLQGHTNVVTSVAVTPDGRLAVSGSWDCTLRVWDLQSHTCVAALAGHTGLLTSVAISADGRRAVSGSADHTLRVWDLQAQACIDTLDDHTGIVSAVAVTPDGRRVVSGSYDATLKIWDVSGSASACVASLQGHTEWVTAVAITPDGRQAVSGSTDKHVCLWDLQPYVGSSSCGWPVLQQCTGYPA